MPAALSGTPTTVPWHAHADREAGGRSLDLNLETVEPIAIGRGLEVTERLKLSDRARRPNAEGAIEGVARADVVAIRT